MKPHSCVLTYLPHHTYFTLGTIYFHYLLIYDYAVLHSDHKVYLCVLYGSQNEHRSLTQQHIILDNIATACFL